MEDCGAKLHKGGLITPWPGDVTRRSNGWIKVGQNARERHCADWIHLGTLPSAEVDLLSIATLPCVLARLYIWPVD